MDGGSPVIESLSNNILVLVNDEYNIRHSFLVP